MISTTVIVIIILYLILIGSLIYGFDKVETFKFQDLKAKTRFTIVIPFRNETTHLPRLLKSIFELNYPRDLFEVILVDDNSDDGSVQLIQDILNEMQVNLKRFKIIKNRPHSKSPKKDAICAAIDLSKNEWIATTDADCVLPKYWLDAFDERIQNSDLNCIVAPVTYRRNDSFFHRFQTLDFLSLQAATIGGFGLNKPFLCNGANFAYSKASFLRVGGFSGNTTVASGDDIFLLEKFKRLHLAKVVYLKSSDTIVSTAPVDTFYDLIDQRLRWASKTTQNPNRLSKLIGISVFLANLVCVALPELLVFDVLELRIVVALLVIKFAIDLLLLFKVVRFLGQEQLLISFVSSSLLYPIFSVYIALLSLFKSYEWKGRVFKK